MNEITPEVNISRTYKNGGVLTKEESESFPGILAKQYPPGVRLATVTQGTRFTRNLGNFESVQIYVEVALPCVLEEIQECFAAGQQFVEEKLTEQLAIVDQHLTSKKR